ncbi:MAG TPA: GNAT family N-acetyltransferase [Flavobacteriales bacterium]|nr:GNAT family N-acetyltransferase [Flavobacteriales bacterium]
MPAGEIHIRKADAKDIDVLCAIGRQTFLETFGKDNTEADMERYLTERFSREQILGEYRDPGSRFFLAEMDGEAVGYMKVNRGEAQTEAMGEKAMEIERVYVLQEFHRQGIGSMLMEQAYGVAQEWQAEWIWLGVWEHNRAAIAFYERCGFTRFGEHVFQLGGDAQTDVLIRKDLGG